MGRKGRTRLRNRTVEVSATSRQRVNKESRRTTAHFDEKGAGGGEEVLVWRQESLFAFNEIATSQLFGRGILCKLFLPRCSLGILRSPRLCRQACAPSRLHQ